MTSPRFTVVSDTGRVHSLRAEYSGQAAGKAAKHWHAPRAYAIVTAPDAVNTDASGVYDVIDQVTRECIDQLTVTPYAAAHAHHGEAMRRVCVTLDDGSADTLRAFGGGNLSLGIRRAATFTGTVGVSLPGVVGRMRLVSVSLDEPTVTTLRALGDGNLSLGIRRAATLIGGSA